MTEFRGGVTIIQSIARGRRIINNLSTIEDDAMHFTDDEHFYKALNAKVNVAKVVASKGRYGVTLDSLSQKWLILLEATSRIVRHTTQQGIRIIIHPFFPQIFNTNERALR